ncbi:MAG: hypothetical protein HC770_01490 [Pseudanabaena sp. CRU_2_10]|nr:hypothetical protein [Pseudanabaena sp. CRU_2_10]
MKSLVHSLSAIVGLIAIQPCIAQISIAQTTYRVSDQSAAYSLTTQISPSQIAGFIRYFSLANLTPKPRSLCAPNYNPWLKQTILLQAIGWLEPMIGMNLAPVDMRIDQPP